MMVTITCDECKGTGKQEALCLSETMESGRPTYEPFQCPTCAGTGEINIDKADDTDVIDALRGASPFTDDAILSSVMRKLGHGAFTPEALEMIADQYRSSAKRAAQQASL